MLETLQNGKLDDLALLKSWIVTCDSLIQTAVLFIKDVMSDSDRRGKDGALHKLVIRASVDEFDHLWCIAVLMGLVVVIDLNLYIWVLQATNIDTC